MFFKLISSGSEALCHFLAKTRKAWFHLQMNRILSEAVVVQFYPWFNFYFLFFFGMVMYDNEIKTKEDKNKTKDKIEPQHSQTQLDDIAHEQTIS